MVHCLPFQISELWSLYSLFVSTNGPYWVYNQSSNLLDLDDYVEEGYQYENNVWNFEGFPGDNVSAYPNPCCQGWDGIVCREFNGVFHVDGIVLAYHNLSGNLPVDLSNMTNLTNFALNFNSLTGSLPPLLGSMSSLQVFNVFANSIAGSIPSTFGQLQSTLTYLNLANNSIVGSIPIELGSLTRLEQLYLYLNRLASTIPSELGYLKQLSAINLSDNQLIGTIPPEFSLLTKLKNFALYSNSVYGSIPSLTGMQRLKYLRVQNNKLSGEFWSKLEGLLSISELDISGNSFSGTIPESVGLMRNMTVFAVNSNNFRGSLPTTLAQLHQLQYLLVQANHFSGPITNITSMAQKMLSAVDLSNNQFSGSIPARLLMLPNISIVAMINNCFSGSLPSEICQENSTLTTLAMDGLTSACQYKFPLFSSYIANFMDGSIPSCWLSLPRLVNLHLAGNGFVGSVPSGNVTAPLPFGQHLSQLRLSFNRLVGSIPVQVQKWPFSLLDLSKNDITGTLDNMESFFWNPNANLNLTNNRLSGNLPNSFYGARHINILQGNLFACRNFFQQPQHDPNSSTAICGSDSLNGFMVVFLAFLVCFITSLIWIHHVDEVVWNQLIFPLSFTATLASSPSNASSKRQVVTRYSVHNSLVSDASLSSRPKSTVSERTTHVNIHPKLRRLANLFKEVIRCIYASVDKDIMMSESYPEAHCFLNKLLPEIRILALVLTAVIIIVFTPFNVGSKLTDNGKYATHTYEYGWTPSLAFLAGVPPALTHFVLTILLIAATLFCISRSKLVLKINHTYHPVINRPTISALRSSYHWTVEYFAKGSRKTWVRRAFLYVLLPFLNFSVMVLANIGYVFTIIYLPIGAVIVVQILLVVLKLSWNMGVLPYFLQRLLADARRDPLEEKSYAWRSIGLQSSLILFNNLLAPCIATMAADADCFYNIFYPSNKITVAFSYNVCTFINGKTGACMQYSEVPVTESYSPPFIYSNQCSSALLTNYVPIFVLMYLYLAFLSPMLYASVVHQCSQVQTKSWWVKAIIFIFPPIFRPAALVSECLERESALDDVKGDLSLLNTGNIVSNLVVNLVILLTFGTAYPPLSVIVGIAIWMDTFQWQAVIGRFFLDVAENELFKSSGSLRLSSNDLQYYTMQRSSIGVRETSSTIACDQRDYLRSIFERNCFGAWKIFEQAEPLIVIPMGLFFAFFVYDMLVVVYGEKALQKLVIILAVVPLFLYLVFYVFRGFIWSQMLETTPSMGIVNRSGVFSNRPLTESQTVGRLENLSQDNFSVSPLAAANEDFRGAQHKQTEGAMQRDPVAALNETDEATTKSFSRHRGSSISTFFKREVPKPKDFHSEL